MKAPTKQRSMKATKIADRRVLPMRMTVKIAHAQARIDTMNSTSMKSGVNSCIELYSWTNHDCEIVRSCEGDVL